RLVRLFAWLTRCPNWGPLPHTSQRLAIVLVPPMRKATMKTNRKFSMRAAPAVKPFLRRSRLVFNSPKLITIFTLVLSSLMAVSCNGPKDGGSTEVAAKVGSREITTKQIDSVIKEQLN